MLFFPGFRGNTTGLPIDFCQRSATVFPCFSHNFLIFRAFIGTRAFLPDTSTWILTSPTLIALLSVMEFQAFQQAVLEFQHFLSARVFGFGLSTLVDGIPYVSVDCYPDYEVDVEVGAKIAASGNSVNMASASPTPNNDIKVYRCKMNGGTNIIRSCIMGFMSPSIIAFVFDIFLLFFSLSLRFFCSGLDFLGLVLVLFLFF